MQKEWSWTSVPKAVNQQQGLSTSGFITVGSKAVCMGCKGEHDLEQCGDFVAKSVEEKKIFYYRKKIMF